MNSKATIADAACTKTCIYLSVVLLLASIGYELIYIGGIDSIGAIGIAELSFKEGYESFQKARENLTCSCACCKS